MIKVRSKDAFYVAGMGTVFVISLLSLNIGFFSFRQIQVSGKHSVREWAITAVEEEHYQLNDDGYLLTHNTVLQSPSLELLEESRGKNKNGFLYGRDNEGYFYQAIFEHTLLVEKYDGNMNKYVYLSAISWRDNSRLETSFYNFFGLDSNKVGFAFSQIIDLDIERVEW